MQKTFHESMRERGGNSGLNEEREAIMDHYYILDPVMRWEFVRSYHTAKDKSEWRRFVFKFSNLPEDAMLRVAAER